VIRYFKARRYAGAPVLAAADLNRVREMAVNLVPYQRLRIGTLEKLAGP
jgi:hypothetical protein